MNDMFSVLKLSQIQSIWCDKNTVSYTINHQIMLQIVSSISLLQPLQTDIDNKKWDNMAVPILLSFRLNLNSAVALWIMLYCC